MRFDVAEEHVLAGGKIHAPFLRFTRADVHHAFMPCVAAYNLTQPIPLCVNHKSDVTDLLLDKHAVNDRKVGEVQIMFKQLHHLQLVLNEPVIAGGEHDHAGANLHRVRCHRVLRCIYETNSDHA